MRTVTVLILCILNSYGLNLAKSYDNQSIENYNNSTCRNTEGVRFCSECHNKVKHQSICECKRWKNIRQCQQQQMKCKKQCGVCLPKDIKKGKTWPECYDHSEFCSTYKDMNYCNVNVKWMKFVCKYTCGFCKVCQDVSAECMKWSNEGLCESLPKYMFENCRKSCNACDCHDNSLYCKIWAENQQCEMNPNAMKERCPLSCNVCGHGNLNQPVLIYTRINTTIATTTKKSTTSNPIHQHKQVLNDEHCGVPSVKRTRRIVGGELISPPRSWPWIIGISSSDFPERVDCGGSLITNQFILTAAHCFVRPGGMDPSIYKIRLGEHHLKKLEGFEVFRTIDRIYVHQNYDQNYDNDIAVLRLTKTVEFSPNRRPACIADIGDEVKKGMLCFVAGWGFQAGGVPGPPELKIVKVPIVDLAECRLKYSLLLEEVTSRMICASGDGNTDSCEGDSGGPMVCQQPDGQFKQMGIVSWGIGCGQKDQYGVYANVAKLRSWLDDLLESEAT